MFTDENFAISMNILRCNFVYRQLIRRARVGFEKSFGVFTCFVAVNRPKLKNVVVRYVLSHTIGPASACVKIFMYAYFSTLRSTNDIYTYQIQYDQQNSGMDAMVMVSAAFYVGGLYIIANLKVYDFVLCNAEGGLLHALSKLILGHVRA